MLTISDLSRVFARGGSRALAVAVRGQLQFQFDVLNGLKVRRMPLLGALRESCASEPSTPLVWAKKSRENLQTNLDSFLAEIKHKGGHKNVPVQYRAAINELVSQSYRAVACLDCVADAAEIEATPRGKQKLPFTEHLDLLALTREVSHDLRALSVEKFGLCPAVEVEGKSLLIETLPHFLRYAIMEVFKNSVLAVIERHGILDVEDLPQTPIVVSSDGREWRCTDLGTGMNEDVRANAFNALFTTVQEVEPTYMYSRDFGVKFAGAGMGLLRVQTYFALHGGFLSLKTEPGKGTELSVCFSGLQT